MANFSAPTVFTAGSQDPAAPLVVLFHGRGSQAQEIIYLAEYLPQELSYAAINAPIAENGGFAWFANKGIGRPVAESLADTTKWFEDWFLGFARDRRKVILVGNSGGGAFVGALIGRDQSKYSGAAILYATLPWEAGIEFPPQLFSEFPIVLIHGEADRIIPAELLKRTWNYLTLDSGALITARKGPEGHGLTQESLAVLHSWILNQLESVES